MKLQAIACALGALASAPAASPAAAQFGIPSGVVKKAATVKKLSDAKVSDAEERQIGQEVSDKVIETMHRVCGVSESDHVRNA